MPTQPAMVETLAHVPRPIAVLRDEVSAQETGREEYEAGGERDSAFAHDPPELEIRDARAILVVVVDRVRDERSRVGQRPALEMHAERERCVHRVLARPTDDVLVRVLIEIALGEGRRVHRVEELTHFVEVQLDQRNGFGAAA